MAQIDLDQELVDFLRANEFINGEAPSVFIHRLIRLHKAQRPRQEVSRSDNSDISVFLKILGEVHDRFPERFPAVESVRGRTRIYFSRDSKEIEASGRSTFPVQIPGTGWWVMSNTSKSDKRKILEKVLRTLNVSPEDRDRWLAEFFGTEEPPESEETLREDDDPFKI